MRKQMLFALMITLLAIMVISCEDENDDATEPDKPYVGVWQSGVYPSISLNGDTIVEQQKFTFTNTEVTDIIKQGPTSDSLATALGIKGSVDNFTDDSLALEIIQISVQGGPYVSKNVDEESFNTTFESTAGTFLYESFKARYIINDDQMQLILPVLFQGNEITDTLNLTKID
jgi:hypothetical protein